MTRGLFKSILLVPALIGTPLNAQAGHQQHLDPQIYCAIPAGERLSLVRDAIRTAWIDLDVHGRATIGRVNPHSANFGISPLAQRDPMRSRMERYKSELQRLMVLTGVLFPQYNRPMDGDRLIGRFATRSVPIFGAAAEHKIAVMEAFLANNESNRELGVAFIEALHAVEDSALALSAGNAAPQFNSQNTALDQAFGAFMLALKNALFSTEFETVLGRRMGPYCTDALSGTSGSP